MTSQIVTVSNRTGIHARPASMFTEMASNFESDITVSQNGKSGNAKSIVHILALGIKNGSEITISASGVDEKEAVNALKRLVESKFDEEC